MLKTILVTIAFVTMSFGQSIEDRVEALEYAGYENWFKFSGQLEYRFDSVEREYKKAYTAVGFDGSVTSRTAGDKSKTDHHRLFAEIDIAAKPSDKLTFYGRLATTKYFNTLNKGGGNYNDDGAFGELSEGAQAGNSRVFLERAFVNYALMKSLTFSVGRLPTIDGAPKHYAEARPMMGNYPNLAFAGIFDGLALTYNRSIMGTTFKLRGIYTPFNQRNISLPYDKLKDGTAGASGNEVDENTDVYSIMFEAEKENLSWVKRVHFIYQYLYFNGLYALNGGSSQRDIGAGGGLANLGTNPTNSTPDGEVETYYDTSSATLGLQRHILNLEFQGLFNTGLNFGISWFTGKTKGEGSYTSSLLSTATSGSFTTGTWYGASNVDVDGDALVLNLSYNFKQLRNATLGFEWMDSDPDAFLYDAASKNRVGFYTARGDSSMHLYWVQPVDQNFKVRVGWQEVNNKATNMIGGYIGPKSDIDDTAAAFYSSLQFFF